MNKLTKEGRMRYERDLKTKSDYDGGIAYAVEKALIEGIEKGQKEGREKGRKEGREKGQKEGIEKGQKEGIEKGRKEGREKAVIEIANKMKKAGLSSSAIHSLTEIPLEEIEQL